MATQSLYRRYRPRRFGEVKGQDHVVKALRDAVAEGREGQAYLFSGPRGTGKTTTARILAKALNCANVEHGEPCAECDSCLAVERGTSYDVHELDAASNNGVEAIRDLIEKASLGTPGRHKVYILDEVHMLSKPAEAALLKTLEEPPPHVVFVLATTDPQKMSDTIRSRTQHLQFHLLPADTLAEHIAWVAGDAGLEVSQEALDAALAQGGGSARDTLSALELIAATGGDVGEVVDLDEFLEAMAEHDTGRALTVMAHAVSVGRDPRTVTEELVRHLRNAFLTLMAPELVVLPRERTAAVAALAQRIGAASVVRAIERLGTTLVDLRNAPDPRVLVEVVLVQLTSESAGGDLGALEARIERLEAKLRDVASLVEAGAAATAATPAGRAVLGGAARTPPAAAPAPGDASGSRTRPADDPAPAAASGLPAGRGVLGDTARTPPASRPAPGDQLPTEQRADADGTRTRPPADPAPIAASGAPPDTTPPTPSPGAGGPVSVEAAWDTAKGTLKGLARPLFAAATLLGERDGVVRFEIPPGTPMAKCAAQVPAVSAALSGALGRGVTVELVNAGGDAPAPSSAPEPDRPATPPAAGRPPADESARDAGSADPVPSPGELEADDEIDLDALTDVPPDAIKGPDTQLADAFPGSTWVTDE
jgi:DNA polymerase-3 subunit gamma/tau